MDKIQQVKRRAKQFEGTHKFLAEELVIPNLNKTDGGRVNMFGNSHFVQSLVIENAETPAVYTGNENQVGKYSSSYRKSDRDWTVIRKIVKNDLNYTLILKDDDNNIDIVTLKPAERITERYGYKYIDKCKEKKFKDKIKKDELMYRSTAYDDNLNFGYGINLKTVYLSWDNMTYEDAIVISKSAASKLGAYSVDEITISLNNNDILLNLYGDKNVYKCFPDIGESTKSSTLAGRRRINYDSILSDMTDSALSKLNYDIDRPFKLDVGDGEVIDIDVYCNAPLETLEKYPYNQQILKYIKMNKKYYQEIRDILYPYISNEQMFTCSDDARYLFRRANDIISENTKWEFEGNEFDNILLKVKVLAKNNLYVGCKLTGRYGNKGCVSLILPDDMMPMNEYGERADVILNPAGVPNRLNPSQLYEQELNFVADNVLRDAKKCKKKSDALKMILDFYTIASPKFATYMKEELKSMDSKERTKFINKILNSKRLYIQQEPFYNNITFDAMEELYRRFDYPKYKMTICGQEIETPLVMGELYTLRLKHDPKSKFSARSTGYLNINNLPSKSTSFKSHQTLYQQTPIRWGEMEREGMMIIGDGAIVKSFLDKYSVNQEDRLKMITALLTDDVFNIKDITPSMTQNITSKVSQTYFTCLGIGIETEY